MGFLGIITLSNWLYWKKTKIRPHFIVFRNVEIGSRGKIRKLTKPRLQSFEVFFRGKTTIHHVLLSVATGTSLTSWAWLSCPTLTAPCRDLIYHTISSRIEVSFANSDLKYFASKLFFSNHNAFLDHSLLFILLQNLWKTYVRRILLFFQSFVLYFVSPLGGLAWYLVACTHIG